MLVLWHRSRGWLAGVVALVACPCHLPVSLPLLIWLTAGTAFSVWLGQNMLLAGVLSTVVFSVGLALALTWSNQPDCPPKPTATPGNSTHAQIQD